MIIWPDFVVVCLLRFLRYALHNTPSAGRPRGRAPAGATTTRKGKKERKEEAARRRGEARDKKEKQSSSRKWLA